MIDYFGYKGKTCVLTGASSGIGKATATLLVEMGAEVYILSRTKPNVEGISSWIQTNLENKSSIDQAFKQLPCEIDRFFGIAGVSGIANSYEETIIIDFLANKYITETYLQDRVVDGGAIAFVTSTSGVRWARQDLIAEYISIVTAEGWDATIQAIKELDQSDNMGIMAYMLAKRAMNYYAATKTAKFADHDIRINVVMPCSTSTPFISEFLSVMGSDDKNFRDAIGNGKEYATPEAMAKAIVYLNSNFAEYISGIGLIVDYGMEAATLCGQTRDLLGMNLI